MNASNFFTFIHLLLNAPDEAKQIHEERRQSYECVQQRQCLSVWNPSLNEYSAYPLDNLKEICGSSPQQDKSSSDANGACNAYYKWLHSKKE